MIENAQKNDSKVLEMEQKNSTPVEFKHFLRGELKTLCWGVLSRTQLEMIENVQKNDSKVLEMGQQFPRVRNSNMFSLGNLLRSVVPES